MNNIDELIELNLYEPISRYLTVLEEENDIIKNLTIKILLSLKAVDDVLRYNCNNEYHFYIKKSIFFCFFYTYCLFFVQYINKRLKNFA